MTTEVTDDKSVSFLMGIVRDGTAVAQVGFVPVKGVTIAPDAFAALTERALDRLDAMPASPRASAEPAEHFSSLMQPWVPLGRIPHDQQPLLT